MEQKKLEALPLFMLQSLAKAKGLPPKGSKQELIDKLSGLKKAKPLPSGGKLGLNVEGELETDEWKGGEANYRELQIPEEGGTVKRVHTGSLRDFHGATAGPGAQAKFGEDVVIDSERSLPQPTKKSRVAQSYTNNFVMPDLPANFALPMATKQSAAGFDHQATIDFRLAKCVHCSTLFNLQKARLPASKETFWCPKCRFQAMDPFNEVAENGVLHCAMVQGPRMQFTLDTPKVDKWKEKKDSVEVRMLRVDAEKISHVWPDDIEVKANGTQLFHIVPPSPNVTRRDVPQDITQGLTSGTNTIEIEMANEPDPLTEFAFAVVHTKSRAARHVCKEVGRCEEAEARERVCRLRKRSVEDAGIAEDRVECLTPDVLKLICPITMDRVEQPVRGRHSEHLQCFGLKAYINSNKAMDAHHNRWVCPISFKTLRPGDLCIDAYVERIIMETKEQALEEVTIAPDGSWQARAVAAVPEKPKLTGTPISTSPSKVSQS